MNIAFFVFLLVTSTEGSTAINTEHQSLNDLANTGAEPKNVDPFLDNVIIEEVVIEPAKLDDPNDDYRNELTGAESIAHLHPALVHMPVAWLLLLFFLEWLLVFRPQFIAEPARVGLWALTIVSFIPSLATGFVFSEWVYADTDMEVMQPILDHRNLILLSTGLLAVGWFVRKRHLSGPATAIILTLAMIAMTLGAHSGGILVYGEDYFPF